MEERGRNIWKRERERGTERGECQGKISHKWKRKKKGTGEERKEGRDRKYEVKKKERERETEM